MKTVSIRTAMLASLAFAPAAFATDAASIQGCMDSFAARHFADSKVTFAIEGDTGFSVPLVARGGTRQVQLVATARNTGRVLATATCAIRDGAKEGRVIVLLPQ
jgi:D-serine deaminase-like pyridoxal phosphate-dependent protein